MNLYNNITEVVGNTPMVRINRLTDGAAGNVYAKLEFYNPTASVKDRIGVSMVDAAEATGELKPGGTIVTDHFGNVVIEIHEFHHFCLINLIWLFDYVQRNI